jgi:hypothetical protein
MILAPAAAAKNTRSVAGRSRNAEIRPSPNTCRDHPEQPGVTDLPAESRFLPPPFPFLRQLHRDHYCFVFRPGLCYCSPQIEAGLPTLAWRNRLSGFDNSGRLSWHFVRPAVPNWETMPRSVLAAGKRLVRQAQVRLSHHRQPRSSLPVTPLPVLHPRHWRKTLLACSPTSLLSRRSYFC